MTVAQLVAALAGFDPDSLVYIEGCDCTRQPYGVEDDSVRDTRTGEAIEQAVLIQTT